MSERPRRAKIFGFAVAAAAVLFLPVGARAAKIDYWSTQRRGANFFPLDPRPQRFRDAAQAGILFGRLAFNKWLNGRPESKRGDFLLGPKGDYDGLNEKDLKYLVGTLDAADKAGVKIVLTTLSLPGSRWLQHNCASGKCEQQYELWRDFKYHKQAAAFWRDLAKALKSHPAVVGYNLLNEPCPERSRKPFFRDWYTMDYEAWQKSVQGTPADLNLFYRTVIAAIREVDAETPIVVDSGFYANPYAMKLLDPSSLGDGKVIFAVHHYEPAAFATRKNDGRYAYPGKLPTGELDVEGEADSSPPYAPIETWDRDKVSAYFKVVQEWSGRHSIPPSRLYVAEFGADRQAPGVVDYFRDHLAYFNAQGWHWSFYSYREDDGFPKMDYELGVGPLKPRYWECEKSYACEKAGLYGASNPLWSVIRGGLSPEQDGR